MKTAIVLSRTRRTSIPSLNRETTLTAGTESPEVFASQSVEFMLIAERAFTERIREFYTDESAEVLKGVRLPVQVLAESMDWDIDQLRASQSLKTELGL